jgi:hypothetical protein
MMTHTCGSSTQEAEAGGWQVEASLGNIVRPSLEKKPKLILQSVY